MEESKFPQLFSQLPDTDAVTVITLNGREEDGLLLAAELFPLRDLAAQEVVSLWRWLPVDDSNGGDMCHMPIFGLRFLRGGAMFQEATLCWRCSNIVVANGGGHFIQGFDPRAEQSMALLHLLQRVTGSDAAA